MADISNVQVGEIKDLWESLENLGCKSPRDRIKDVVLTM